MGENTENSSLIENLAIVTDAMQNIFPNGKIICVYELNETEFKMVQNNFRSIDNQHKRFSIDISEMEHVFILENLSIIENKPKKKTIYQRLFSWFKSGGSSVK